MTTWRDQLVPVASGVLLAEGLFIRLRASRVTPDILLPPSLVGSYATYRRLIRSRGSTPSIAARCAEDY